MQIAALYVDPKGCYVGLPFVDPWTERRDARRYPGPFPVVAHPPCARWGRYWSGGPVQHGTRKLGDDNGCFAAALAAVRCWGGVLEHPEASHAWWSFGLNRPPYTGGWVVADFHGGWTCCVEQGHYGHAARKATWLYAVDTDLPSLQWGSSGPKARLDDGYHSADERRRMVKSGVSARLTRYERIVTPLIFRDILIAMAESVTERRLSCPTS